jgi:hypothetical protein
MITNARYKAELDTLHKLHRERIEELKNQHRVELQQARDLTSVLKSMSGNLVNLGSRLFGDDWQITGNCYSDDIAQYVPDVFGGRCIKQEATKVITIDPNGEVTTGLTKMKPDVNYSYILRRL